MTEPTTAAETSPTTTTDSAPDTLMCVLSYLGIFSLIPFFAKKDDAFVQWHARQGLGLLVAAFAIWVVLFIIQLVLASISETLAMLFGLVTLLFGLGVLALAIIGIVKAVGGEHGLMPLIGPIVNKG